MESYQVLRTLLQDYEDRWAATAYANRHPTVKDWNGAVQFVGIEPAPEQPEDEKLPIVVAVGVNYDQSNKNGPRHFRWLRDFCQIPDGVTDVRWWPSPMRQALDTALAAQEKHHDAWHAERPDWEHWRHASSGDSMLARRDYILLATNLVPFITERKWTSTDSSSQTALCNDWNRTDHLDDLVQLLVGREVLWVGHGSDHVWRGFKNWISRYPKLPWLLTYNLSGLGLANMAQARGNPKHVRHDLFK